MLLLSELIGNNFRSTNNTTIQTKYFKVISSNQRTYKLDSVVLSGEHVLIFHNGKLVPNYNYTINNDTITLNQNVNLNVDDTIIIFHFRSIVVNSLPLEKTIDEFVVTNSQTFTLTNQVASKNDIIVSVNGLIIEPSNYFLQDSTTLVLSALPPPNSKVVVIYLKGAIVTSTSILPNSVTLHHLALDSIDTRYARIENTYTKSEIDQKINNLIDNAPELLNSLSEIANALNNDPNFATNIQNQLANKANKVHGHNDYYYTKTEIDMFLNYKASKENYYNIGQILTLLGEKANRADVYTKAEVDQIINSQGTVVIPVSPGNRGIFTGGLNNLAISKNIEFFNINTFGNSVKFGEISQRLMATASASNGIGNVGLIAGGFNNQSTNKIEKINILQASNAVNFGQLTAPRSQHCAVSNGTNNRAVWIGGTGGFIQDMEYSTINTPGNGVLFGNILGTMKLDLAGTSNGTNDRGVFGTTMHPVSSYVLQFITIPTLSNSVVFGNFFNQTNLAAVSNDTHNKGVFGGGLSNGSVKTKALFYINIAIQGDAQTFGILTIERSDLAAASNGINQRAIFAGGIDGTNSYSSEVDFITIAVNANAAPFGDLLTVMAKQSAMSNGSL